MHYAHPGFQTGLEYQTVCSAGNCQRHYPAGMMLSLIVIGKSTGNVGDVVQRTMTND